MEGAARAALIYGHFQCLQYSVDHGDTSYLSPSQVTPIDHLSLDCCKYILHLCGSESPINAIIGSNLKCLKYAMGMDSKYLHIFALL